MTSEYEAMAAEELTDITEEEKKYVDAALASITEEQRKKISHWDILTIIRGYQTYEPRLEETNKAMKMVADWRDLVQHEKFLKERLDGDEKFHEMWPERVYGPDKLDHLTVGFRVEDIDTDGLTALDKDHLLRLQGQKMTALTHHKEDVSKAKNVQRYKHSLVVDLAGSGMSLLSGSKRHIMKEIMDVGGNYYPESIWKIYAINAPWVFRACWGIVKPWVHPITQAKVNVLGGVAAATKKMQEDGIPLESIPDWAGGKATGRPLFEILLEYIENAEKGEQEEKKEEGEAVEKKEAAAAAAAAPASSPGKKTIDI